MVGKMQKINVNWGGIFANAYTYSSNYLLLSLMIIVASVIWVWIYEKPQLYKLIFKKSKHSHILSPIESNEGVEGDNVISNLDSENPNIATQKRLAEISRNTLPVFETPDTDK